MWLLLWALAAAMDPSAQAAADADAAKVAAAFGARPGVSSPSLSPDGKFVVYVAPAQGQMTVAKVTDLSNGETKVITYADGKPLRLSHCGWSATNRIVCELYGISRVEGTRLPWTRWVALDADGKNVVALGQRNGFSYIHQYDGEILDWLAGDGKVMMARGSGVEIVDTRTGKGQQMKPPVENGWTDGNGSVRIIGIAGFHNGELNGKATYQYRLPKSSEWKPFSRVDADGNGLTPLAVDGAQNVVYASQKLDGRDALYRVALDGTMKTELVYADPKVDVDTIDTIGRHGRVIGYSYDTDQTHTVYFDPDYRALAAALAKSLPNLPGITFVSASADEKKLLLFAESDRDAGHYYLLDRTTRHMTEALIPRPEIESYKLSEQRSISYTAADGTVIPAYLTLPPGSDGRNLPAIVMPHGGPASRDVWGFDWLPQFFAQRGFAVIQPQFRGSTGYGDAFLVKNGYKSWRTAISDVLDAGRWMIAKGIANPKRLDAFGWSYGGYAVLQANTIDANLFKAIVAVAPVTDLSRLKEEASNFTNGELMAKFIGSDTAAGSPDRHAQQFVAPVLLFHGDQDVNVDIAESKLMDAALRKAGKKTQLIVYPGLDHQLDDADARTDLLTRADSFFRNNW